jgi:hypothetical protein
MMVNVSNSGSVALVFAAPDCAETAITGTG